MADAIYAKEVYSFGEYLVVCLPAVLLQFFPHALRESVKLPIYGLSALIGLFALWRSTLLLRFAIAQRQKCRRGASQISTSNRIGFLSWPNCADARRAAFLIL